MTPRGGDAERVQIGECVSQAGCEERVRQDLPNGRGIHHLHRHSLVLLLLHLLLYGQSRILLHSHSHSQGSCSLLQQLRYRQTRSAVEHKLTYSMKLENASCLMHDDKRIISNQLDQDHLNAAIAIA